MVIYVIMSDVYACIRKLTGRKKKVPTFWVAEITLTQGTRERLYMCIISIGNNGFNIYKSIFPMKRKKPSDFSHSIVYEIYIMHTYTTGIFWRVNLFRLTYTAGVYNNVYTCSRDEIGFWIRSFFSSTVCRAPKEYWNDKCEKKFTITNVGGELSQCYTPHCILYYLLLLLYP